mmetsp:Transcript_5139/g.10522  ORF Transcript_5139/g.10522 Transcript_5139/m.10522 type:complete len:317 (-) Transcript_5139:468-1418(-)|eukprot:CAMPEP_0118926036 /NCGR_PEP_ID=MMETSP1169-20130426/3826_1 /TAXON_ID=36882 /ORGANISM="Pyramimonas obovata, Strain CCMP722" /LENGTH=316 /DNA_ID=CAMNT_0006867499 /DNA_START=67 /DNA_END=1017 /DNA_ORIENTATION=+
MAATTMSSRLSMSRTAHSSSASARKASVARSTPAAASSMRGVALGARRAGKAAAARRAVVTMAVQEGDVLLEAKNVEAVIDESGKEILKGVSITIKAGEVHAIMGKNGSGKSTFSKVLVGHPSYRVTGGEASLKGKDLFDMEPEERSHDGLFLSFQSPIEIPGVSNTDFLRASYNARRKALGEPELDPLEFYAHLMPKLEALNMDISFLNRNVNEGFSGGEKKRNEILQLSVLEADVAILDEIDSGLDVDALRDVAAAVNGLKSANNAVLMITHYQRLLDYIEPDFVHIMEAGRIVKTGGKELALQLEEGGFAALK